MTDFLAAGAWRVVEVDGAPILDGPGLGGGSAGELRIGGCLLGSDFGAAVNPDGTLDVDPGRPLVDYECDPSPTPVDTQRLVGDIVFGSPAIVVDADAARVGLVSEVGTLHLRQYADVADLRGEWEVQALNGESIQSDLRLAFGQVGSGDRAGAVELRACGAVVATYHYDLSAIFDGGDAVRPPSCESADSDEVEAVNAVLRRLAVLLELDDDRADFFDGGDRLHLTRSLALGPVAPGEKAESIEE
ncbi:MAG: hypothetical protein R8F63_06150 [Acidimicrobiales bacterium]|nr:hypothetical protein [Acidimicrobiales bacterium]